MTSIRLFGTSFTQGDAGAVLAAAAAGPPTRPRLIVTANMDHVISLSENAAFRGAYERAAARTLDGVPLVWLARLRGARTVRRVTGHDLLGALMREPPSPDRRMFLVCATPQVADAMTGRLVATGMAPDAIASAVPPLGFEADAPYGRRLAAQVRAHATTHLIMGVGAPKSEIWVDEQGAALGTPIVLAIGEALNVAAGLVPRAPIVMQRAGLEWLFRFAHAPRRLFHRYFVRSWRFLAIALR